MIGWGSKPADKTSFGAITAQIRVAAVTLGFEPSELTTRDQLELAICLMEDDFNLRVTANYLRDLILYDYPDVATLYMSDEQYIMAGVRYNRGVQRRLEFFIRLIRNVPKRGTEDYNYISYGMRLLEIREHIRTLLRE